MDISPPRSPRASTAFHPISIKRIRLDNRLARKANNDPTLRNIEGIKRVITEDDYSQPIGPEENQE
eukprot:95466-Hanusia_phi.AAC.1